MKHNVLTPSVGESITEVSILKWAKPDGAQVRVGDLLLEIESDKATVEIVAEHAGALAILKPAGERLPIGALIGTIDDSVEGTIEITTSMLNRPLKADAPKAAAALAGPAARKAMAEAGIEPGSIPGSGKDGRVTKGDVTQAQTRGAGIAAPAPAVARPAATGAGDRRVPMSMLRAKIAERLVQAQHTAAILTTFNEADMGPIMKLRNQHKDAFKNKHGTALSFMSFFARASIEALKANPEVNASVDGRDMIYHDYYDVGIAVGTERGLVVPVVRDANKLGFVEIEKRIAELAIKARDGKLSIADLSGGTFTISNGGVYGSLLSTPILNPPQSGILGMHKIQDRPVAVEGRVEIRPMMYLALSYDHRIVDGKGAVTFLVTLKDYLEHPEKLGLEY